MKTDRDTTLNMRVIMLSKPPVNWLFWIVFIQKIFNSEGPILPFSWLLIEETSISKNSNSGRQLCKSRVLGYMEGLLYKATAPRLFRKKFWFARWKMGLAVATKWGAHMQNFHEIIWVIPPKTQLFVAIKWRDFLVLSDEFLGKRQSFYP